MINSATAAIKRSLASLREVFAEADVRRLQLAHATSLLSLWSFGVASAVYAFGVGGAVLVGVMMFVRMGPAAVASPFAAVLADRYSRRRVLLATDLVRAVLVAGGAACVALDLPSVSVFVLTAALVVASTAFEPAKNALLPDLVRSPAQLIAANASGNTLESTSMFAGPALGGALLGLASIEVTMAVSGGLLCLSAAQLARIQGDTGAPAPEVGGGEGETAAGVGAGFKALREDSQLRLLVGLMSAQTFVDGILAVLIVVTALDLLALGQAGVGLLDASVGIGGILAGFAALSLGERRLAPVLGAGLVLWGVPIALIGAVPETAAAVAMLVVVGVGNTCVDVSGFTLMQRAVPDQVRGRVFGVLEGSIWASVGIGGAVAPALIGLFGIRGALVVTGLVLPTLAVLSWSSLARLDADADAPTDKLTRLHALGIFSPLDPARIEALAEQLVELQVPAGEEITTQGAPGDRFYIIDSGEVEVFEDGVRVRTEGPGDFFGEIALLRGTPRTATVRAITDLQLLGLTGEDFIAAVTGHAESARQADAVIAARLGSAKRQLPLL